MNFRVKTTPDFDKEVKRIAKKHKGIVESVSKLIDDLETNPLLGTNLGQNVYKVRLAISGTNKGKSGGARVITYVVIVKETVFLADIYLKSEQDSVENEEVIQRLKDFGIF
jgi:mRNA-degrading endonuclease RelE of RelBE toxin-antitoxin system